MNKNAEAFKAYLEEKDIQVFEVEELEGDNQETAVFRSHITTEGQQLPTAVMAGTKCRANTNQRKNSLFKSSHAQFAWAIWAA